MDQILTRIYTVYSSNGTEKYSVQFHRDGELLKPTRNLLKNYKSQLKPIKVLDLFLTIPLVSPISNSGVCVPPPYGREDLMRIPRRKCNRMISFVGAPTNTQRNLGLVCRSRRTLQHGTSNDEVLPDPRISRENLPSTWEFGGRICFRTF